MDVLTSKQLRQYNNLSRYLEVPFYYHTLDNKYICSISKPLKTTTACTEYISGVGDTFDSIALKFYGIPTYYWIIADFNRVLDPLVIIPPKSIIKIPVLTAIEFED